MPVLDTPAMDSMADAFSSPQDSFVRDSELQASAPEQPERRYPLRERKTPQRFYQSLVNLSVHVTLGLVPISTLLCIFIRFSFSSLQEGAFVISQESLCSSYTCNSLSSERTLSIFDHATLRNYISAVIYSSISSYTSLERAKIKLSEKKYFGLRKPIIFCKKNYKQAYFCIIILKNF